MSKHTKISPLSQKSIAAYLKPWMTPLLLGLLCFLVYNANLRQIGAPDTLPARYQPLILWRDGALNLDQNALLVARGHSTVASWNRPAGADEGKIIYFEPWAYWMVRTRQHELASLYPVVTPALVAPLYFPAVTWLDTKGWEQPQVDRVAVLMEKIMASLIASVASILMYLILRRDNNRWSLPLALVFAFGTNTWMISSQALWQHGVGQLLVALSLLLVIVRASPARTVLLGAVCVFMAANRPPDALIAGAIGLYVLWSRKHSILWLAAGATIPLMALLYYNVYFMGHIAGGYAVVNPPEDFFQPIWSGVAGLLVSPTRGLLIFSPFLIFIFVGLVQRLRTPDTKGLAIALSFAVLAQILLYAQADWRAGTSWGPRWLSDLLPILVWMLAPAPLVLRPLARSLLILTMVVSIGIQAIGAFWYTKTSDEIIFAKNPDAMSAAWDFRNIPFITELRHQPARGDLLYEARGSLDRVGATLIYGTDESPTLEHGAVLEGWALIGGHTPAQLIVLIDGIVISATTDFLPREDVNQAMNTTSPSGWRIYANTTGVAPGERVLQLAVRFEPRSDIRIIREQRVLVVAQAPPKEIATQPQNAVSVAELQVMAKRAAQLLAERQTEEGYWLTMHTTGLRYETPQPEMNTFLTSMLVDLLSPVAPRHGIEDVVKRAQQHLIMQIESNGLVRYHGLPDSPIIGTLGCAITPDSDDSALVWRILGPDTGDPRQQSMLATLDNYRDIRGLYRTWLAPQAQYQCIDPGSDPNPTDLTIQMHVYLMLREFDPPAAQNLCSAIQRSFLHEDVWVYYAKTPLVPYLRSAELRQLGCEIPLPVERLALPAAEQEIWSNAARLLAETMTTAPNENTRQAIRNLLVFIGNDDFAQLRNSPPMLYHNDLSATVSRFYWSEDFGYALWLQLYEAVGVDTGTQQP